MPARFAALLPGDIVTFDDNARISNGAGIPFAREDERIWSWTVRTIREARDVRGISIAELARRSMIESSQLGKVFRYERGLKPGECMRVCFALGVAVCPELMPDEILARLCELNMRRGGEPGKRK